MPVGADRLRLVDRTIRTAQALAKGPNRCGSTARANELQQHPRHHGIGRGHPINVVPFKLCEEAPHRAPQSQTKSSPVVGRQNSGQPRAFQ